MITFALHRHRAHRDQIRIQSLRRLKTAVKTRIPTLIPASLTTEGAVIAEKHIRSILKSKLLNFLTHWENWTLEKSGKKWQNKEALALAVKWNKNHDEILAERTLNKRKQNKGVAQPARQRRQLVSGKLKTEIYPLAAERVVLEFKLRRAKGCKVSKLWLTRKMKEKIEACHGREAAEKFKASRNWFHRFKNRHKISFWRRTNKKQNSASDGKETIQHFQRNLRKSLKTTRRRWNAELDPKFGR